VSTGRLALVVGMLLGACTRCFSQATAISEFPVPTANSSPSAITLGANGALWFVEARAQFTVGRITAAGKITEFPVETMGTSYAPYGTVGITAGPDGNIWLSYAVLPDGPLMSVISQVTPSGQIRNSFQPPTRSQLGGITSGPDGALWFTETDAGRIGRITTDGQIEEYIIPTTGSQPTNISSGPDGALWFTDAGNGQVGRITTAHVFSAFPLTSAFGNNRPTSIVSGSDGAMWFTAPPQDGSIGSAFIGRITTTGTVSVAFQIPQANSHPQLIITGPDGSLWFTDSINNQLDSLSTNGTFTQYSVPTSDSGPFGVASGPDSAVWFTEQNGNNIGRLGVFSITTTTLPPGVTGTGYSTKLLLQGGAAGNAWSISAGSLPDGLSLDPATGLISGTPSTAGSSTFTVQVQDMAGPQSRTVSRALTITVTGLPSFGEFAVPTAGSAPGPIALGPDGALWFTEGGPQPKIGRVDTTKTFTEYPVTPLTGAVSFGGIAAGPDGNLWFTCSQSGTSYIGRITLAGAVTLFQTATYSSLQAITLGPDGALWFTEGSANKIGRITTGESITEFPVITAGSSPYGITSGPDGALWFTESASAQVGRITATGAITEYSLTSQYSGTGKLTPTSIVSGPDGALWLTITNPSLIGRMTTGGAFSYFAAPQNSSPAAIIKGPDGSLWFTDAAGNQIDSITTGGAITQHTVPTGGSLPSFLAVGLNGDLWFTEQQGNNIGHLIINTTIREYATPTANSNPGPITTGADGALWFAEQGPPLHIARVTTSGSISEYALVASAGTGTSSDQIGGIAAGPDGNIWYTVSDQGGASYIGSVTSAGVMQPSVQAITPTTLQGIAAGPDGALWFVATSANQIGRITTSGAVTEFAIPTAGSQPYGIALGPDQALWFTEQGSNKIGRITTGGLRTEYALPAAMQGPLSIVAGKDNSLYFALSDGQIGQITTSGTITSYAALTAPASFGIALGPDGNAWFTDPNNNQIHQLGGAQYTIPAAHSLPSFMTLGPDSALWFTESGASKVGRLGVPTLVSTSLPSGVASAPYSAIVKAQSGTAPYTFTIASGSLPAGLSLNKSTGVISGTPTTAGSFPFSIGITDSGSPQAVSSTQAVTIVIASQVGPLPLTIVTPSVPIGAVGIAYSVTFAAQGGIAPYSWTAAGLPAGLTLSAAGVLSGSPTQPGTYSVSIQVADSSSPALTATQTFALTISAQGTALIITTAPAPSGTAGLYYSTTLGAQGGTAPYSWTATGLPPGLSLSTAGVLSGTPTSPGSYAVAVQVADSSSPALSATQNFGITIVPASSSSGTSGSPVSITGLSATQQPGQAINAGLQLNQTYPSDISGTLSLSFTGNAAGLPTPYVNPGVCFTTVASCASTPQTTSSFTIPAGSTVLSLPAIQTGTVAGTITLTVTASGQPAVTSTVVVPAIVPVIEANSVQITNVTSSGFVVELVASSTPRDVQSATFTFSAGSGTQLTGPTTFTVDVSSLLSQWYRSSAGQSYGSLFSLRAPFTHSGDSSAIGSVSVTLTNSVGTSAVGTGSQ